MFFLEINPLIKPEIGLVFWTTLSFLLLLFVFYEIAIVPKYFLIAIWGSTRREYAAMKLALYSFVGSAMVLAGLVAAYVVSGSQTFNLIELAKYPFPVFFQNWVFPLVFVGFAILAGMWPFHTWAPTGHSAAPTAASMLLAGVVMKLGAYGCLRVAMTLFPEGLATWRNAIGGVAVVGILYGALVALTQRDFKFVIGYSSVSHMGFVILGLMTLSTIGLSGAVPACLTISAPTACSSVRPSASIFGVATTTAWISATPPPGTMPSSTAARVACNASSTRAFFSFISVSVAAPTSITATPQRSRCAITSGIGVVAIKHRSAEPGVGVVAFGSISRPF